MSKPRREIVVHTNSAEATREVGRALGAALQSGDVLLVQGEFGAGKTTLAQGIGEGLGVREPVTSPSYVLANEYQGRIPLYHLDLYRVEAMDQATLEALAEYFASDGAAIVEWPASLPTELVPAATHILMTIEGEAKRRLAVSGAPVHLRKALAPWARHGAAANSGRGAR